MKILPNLDEHTRESLSAIVDDPITGPDFGEQLDVLPPERGMSKVPRLDNGPERIGGSTAKWTSGTKNLLVPQRNPGKAIPSGHSRENLETTASVLPSSARSTTLKASSDCGRRNTTPLGRTLRWGIQPRALMLDNGSSENKGQVSQRLDPKRATVTPLDATNVYYLTRY